jgi:hypothetical protein
MEHKEINYKRNIKTLIQNDKWELYSNVCAELQEL